MLRARAGESVQGCGARGRGEVVKTSSEIEYASGRVKGDTKIWQGWTCGEPSGFWNAAEWGEKGWDMTFARNMSRATAFEAETQARQRAFLNGSNYIGVEQP